MSLRTQQALDREEYRCDAEEASQAMSGSRCKQTAVESRILESGQRIQHEDESGLIRIGLILEVLMNAAYDNFRSHDKLRLH